MTEIVAYITGAVQWYVIAWIIYGPNTAFKQGFIQGLTLRFIWGRWLKK